MFSAPLPTADIRQLQTGRRVEGKRAGVIIGWPPSDSVQGPTLAAFVVVSPMHFASQSASSTTGFTFGSAVAQKMPLVVCI
jgi:hypothetical protein